MTAASASLATAQALAFIGDPSVWRGELEVWNETYYRQAHGDPDVVVDIPDVADDGRGDGACAACIGTGRESGGGVCPACDGTGEAPDVADDVEAACPVCRPGAVADGVLEGGPVSAPATYLEARRIAKSLGFAITLLVGAGTLAGCAGPVTHVPAPSAQSVSEMRATFNTFDARAKEREVGTGADAAHTAIDRVRQRIMPAAQRVCARYFSSGCPEAFAGMKVRVFPNDETINAFAAADGTLGFFGGFVRMTGNDDELAAVFAHEVAHILFGHNQATAANKSMGMLVGGALGLALGAALYEPGMDTDVISDLTDTGAEAGYRAGSIVYSPQMELEADHFAVFVLAEAGYDPEKGGKVFVRMSRTQSGDRAAGRKSFVSYFNTHPADDYRLAAWYEAVAAVSRGQRTPMSAEQARESARMKAYNSTHCQRIRTQFPKCKWWEGKYDMAWGWDCPTKGVFPLMLPSNTECIPPQ